MAYTLTFSLALGSSQTGLTLSAQLKDTTGANVGGAITTGFYEVGLGNYTWTYASIPDAHRGLVVFSAAGVVKAIAAINPEEAENTDVKTSTRAVAGSVTVSSPVSAAGNITVVRGDDYKQVDGRALSFTLTNAPSITGATLKFTAVNRSTGTTLVLTPTVTSATAFYAEMTKAQTATLGLGAIHAFDVQATLASGNVVTLVTGTMTVVEDHAA